MADYHYALAGGGEDDDNDNDNDDGDLARQSWYWGNVDKEEASRILMAKSHGHFLVRDSATLGEYTLVVRRKERVRNIRILRGEGGGYGVVANQCHFGQVADLILYLMDHPRFLHQHFANIDLLCPLSKPESVSEEPTPDLLYQLVLRNKDLIQHNDRYVNVVKERKVILQEIEQAKELTGSLTAVLSLFEEQVALLNVELSGDLMRPVSDCAADEESASVAQNRTAIHERIVEIRTQIEKTERQQRELTKKALRQLETLHQLRPTLSQVQQDVTFLRLRVEERGLVKEYLDLLLKDDKDTDLSHYDPRNWNVRCNRQESERLLSQRVPGTFLVRPGSDGGYVVSIACSVDDQLEILHCKIHMDPRRFQYGFHVDYCIFCSLEELVQKHQTISLKFYNSRLDVCLTYPINYRRSEPIGNHPER